MPKLALFVTEAEEIIAKLDLKPLPHEGGFFVPRWQSTERLVDGRLAGTAIYFLLTLEGFSAFHRLRGPEIWHFYAGRVVEHMQLSVAGDLVRSLLGPNVMTGHLPQIVVPGGTWQAARLAPDDGAKGEEPEWALVGCTMTPGWDERDFSLANETTLLHEFPSHSEVIKSLTRADEGKIQQKITIHEV